MPHSIGNKYILYVWRMYKLCLDNILSNRMCILQPNFKTQLVRYSTAFEECICYIHIMIWSPPPPAVSRDTNDMI